MPAKSKAQQKAAGAALAAKRGEQKVGNLKGAFEIDVQIDERRSARGIRLNQTQGQAGACEVGAIDCASFETPTMRAPQDDGVWGNAFAIVRHGEEPPKAASRTTHVGGAGQQPAC